MRKDGIKNGQARPSDKPIFQGDLDYAPLASGCKRKTNVRITPTDVMSTSSYEY